MVVISLTSNLCVFTVAALPPANKQVFLKHKSEHIISLQGLPTAIRIRFKLLSFPKGSVRSGTLYAHRCLLPFSGRSGYCSLYPHTYASGTFLGPLFYLAGSPPRFPQGCLQGSRLRLRTWACESFSPSRMAITLLRPAFNLSLSERTFIISWFIWVLSGFIHPEYMLHEKQVLSVLVLLTSEFPRT